MIDKLIKGNGYWVRYSDGGLYNKDYELVRHADLERFTKSMAMAAQELHAKIMAAVIEKQLESQRERTSVNIFDSICTLLEGNTYDVSLGYDDRLKKLIEDIIEAFDDEAVKVITNARRSFIMPCSDRPNGFKVKEVKQIFERFITVSGNGEIIDTHIPFNLMDRFLNKVLLYP